MDIMAGSFSVQSSLTSLAAGKGRGGTSAGFNRLLADLVDARDKARSLAGNLAVPVESESSITRGALSGAVPFETADDTGYADRIAGEVDEKAARKALEEELMRQAFLSRVYNWREELAEHYDNLENRDDPAGQRVAGLVGPERADSPEVTGLPAASARTDLMEPESDSDVETSARPFQVSDRYEARKKAGARKTRHKVEAAGDDDDDAAAVTDQLFGNETGDFGIERGQSPLEQILAEANMGEPGSRLPNGLRKKSANGMTDVLAGGYADARDWLRLNHASSVSDAGGNSAST